jgi:hypothetical protein
MREKTTHLTITRDRRGYYSACINGHPEFHNCEDLATVLGLITADLEARRDLWDNQPRWTWDTTVSPA